MQAEHDGRDDARGRIIGRYAIYDEIAAGGMATVHLGRMLGPVGFARTVAIKRLYPMFAKDPEFVSMFLDEARLAARIRHPNVVPTLDIVARGGELFLVMEYIEGSSLSFLARTLRERRDAIPPAIASGVMIGVLEGLHAAHEATSERGEPLGIVHRDVSPQNVLVGTDGISRLVDFGIAKAAGRLQTTREGQVKGKIAYMSPEQLQGRAVDRRSDVYSSAVVLWEILAGRRLFDGDNDMATMAHVLERKVEPPSHFSPTVPVELDGVVMRGLARNARERFSSAREMAVAVEQALGPESPREIGQWARAIAGELITERCERLAQIESSAPEQTGHTDQATSGLRPAAPESAISLQSYSTPANGVVRAMRRRFRALGAAGGGLLVLAGLTTFWQVRARTTGGRAPVFDAALGPVEVAKEITSAVVVSPPPSPAASPDAATPAQPSASSRARVRAPRNSPSPARLQCSPPYTFVEGIRVPKPECM